MAVSLVDVAVVDGEGRGRPGLPWRANVRFSFGHKRIDGVSRRREVARPFNLLRVVQRELANNGTFGTGRAGPEGVLGRGLVRGHVTVTGR